MILDMHVHTDRYSSCAKMSPDAMARSALAHGMDGVVITEHDILWSRAEVDALRARYPDLTILRGIEVSTRAGHALTYGIAQAEVDTFDDHMPLTRLTRIAHAAGGIVILAHPARYDDRIPRVVYRAGLDGVEVMSYNIRGYMQRPIEALQAELNVPGIAGTDAHSAEFVGLYGTDFDAAIETESDLVEAIRARAFSLYQDPDRIRAFNARTGDPMEQLLRKAEVSLAPVEGR